VTIIRLDDQRIQFQLPESFAPFLDYLTIGILPDHLLRGVTAGQLIDHPFNLEPLVRSSSSVFWLKKTISPGQAL
jgi:peptide/nickel transport system substrate-binding protein